LSSIPIPRTRVPQPRAGWLGWIALLIALLVALPLIGMLPSLLGTNTAEVWRHLAHTILPRSAANSIVLAVSVALGVALIGSACAWVTSGFEFPGRRWLQWALVLPLAMPAYVVAYAYTDLLQFSGPVQSAVRALTGWRAREYWFPEIRSLPGAAVLFVLVLFPYVYLPVRAALLERSPHLLDAARLAGLSAAAAFWRVLLPLARPALAAGVALAVMETLADYGTVSYFAVDTFTTSIYKAWFGLGERAAAVQLSLLLLGIVALVIVAERIPRGARRYPGAGTAAASRMRLTGAAAWSAIALCALPVLLGFALPAGMLLEMALRDREAVNLARYAASALNSLGVAGLAALIACAAAVLLGYAARLRASAWVRAAVRACALGYAVPGAVLAVAILVPLARFDNALDAFLHAQFGVRSGLLLTGSIAALVYAYVVRFLALALSSVEAGLARITPSMDDAARGLGCGPVGLALRVHAPLLARSLLVAALLVFVDALKELPATLVLRPFDFDTLAVQAYNLAKDERLGEAALPSLTIVAVGLIPVVLLSRALDRRG
jgi:iron(III) transport system permease protein